MTNKEPLQLTNHPLYVITAGGIDENKLRAPATTRPYYSWLQVYSNAYQDNKGQEKVNMMTVKIVGIKKDDTLELEHGDLQKYDAELARRKWNELVSDFGWKVQSFKDKKFYRQVRHDLTFFRDVLYAGRISV